MTSPLDGIQSGHESHGMHGDAPHGHDGHAAAPLPYSDEDIADVLDAPTQPQALLSPTREHMLLVQSDRYPSIKELSEPMLRLAGLRINPATVGPHAPPRVSGLTLVEITSGKLTKIDVPSGWG